MEARTIPLHKNKHGKLKVRDSIDFNHIKARHLIPVVVHEFVHAATEFPVVFVKNTDTGQFQSVLLLGLRPEENLYSDREHWKGVYTPMGMRSYPFTLLPGEQNNQQLLVGITETSDIVGESEGQPLFEENGDESEFLKKRKEFLLTYFEYGQVTRNFIALLSELELLTPLTITVQIKADKINLNGVYFVDENKLNELPEEKFNDLRKRGFLPPIYAHLLSFHQFQRLARMKSQR